LVYAVAVRSLPVADRASNQLRKKLTCQANPVDNFAAVASLENACVGGRTTQMLRTQKARMLSLMSGVCAEIRRGSVFRIG
jgi:hypothetical protein